MSDSLRSAGPWTPEEDGLLRSMAAAGESVAAIMKPLNRTAKSVRRRAGVLKIKLASVPPRAEAEGELKMRHTRMPWTREEEEELRALILSGKSEGAIAKKLNRTLPGGGNTDQGVQAEASIEKKFIRHAKRPFPSNRRLRQRKGSTAAGESFGILSWTGNESISGNPSGVPILDSFTTHGAFKAADLARLCNVLAAVINRAAFTGSMTGF
jgi:hypothetical protein